MDDRVIPIAILSIDWQRYLSTSSEWLDHPPSKGVDSCPSRLSDIAKYVASLGEFLAGKETNAKRVLRERGPWLQHVFFSFMILTSERAILRIAETTDLHVLSSQVEEGRGAVVSGTLDRWKDAVVLCCGEHSTKRVRLLFNEVKRVFDHVGLQDVFFDFSIKDAGDGTFLLEHK